MYITTEQEATI